MGKSKKRRQAGSNPAAQVKNDRKETPAESSVPKFEIGVKGDEFDRKYTRAAGAKTKTADSLLKNLSKETSAAGYNLLNLAVPALLMLFMALSFALLSREGTPPKLSAKTLGDGSFGREMSAYYKDGLPFGSGIRTFGAAIGLGDAPTETEEEEYPDEDIIPEEPEATEPAVTEATVSQPEITTAPTAENLPTSAPSSETEEVVKPDTFRMYANATLDVRLAPDSDSMIMGYFDLNERVEVVEIGDDGWASIWYNNMIAYVSSELLGETKIRITEATTEETEETTEETEEEVTEPTEVSEEETSPDSEISEETTEATTTAVRYLDPDLSRYMSRQSKMAESTSETGGEEQ